MFQICSPHPAVCHWQGHRRLTSVLSGVAWGSWSAQLEIRQIYLDHEDKVVHLENDCDSVRPWCPLQLHRRVWPGYVYCNSLKSTANVLWFLYQRTLLTQVGGDWRAAFLDLLFKSRWSKDNWDEHNWSFTLKLITQKRVCNGWI